MKLVGSFVAALIASLLCIAVWAGISAGLNVEAGIVAWGVGLVVGLGAVIGARGEGGLLVALIAIVMSVAGIMGGKYAAAHFMVSSYMKEQGITSEASDHDLTAYVAGAVITDREEQGEKLEWPKGKSINNADAKRDFPEGVWDEAESILSELPDKEKEELRDELEVFFKANLSQQASKARDAAFMGSFGIFDILWFVLAIATAGKFGLAGSDSIPG